jgi:hypothetical protein
MATQAPLTSQHTVSPLDSTPLNANFSYEFRVSDADGRCKRVTAEECKEIDEFLKTLQDCVEISKGKDIKEMKLECSLSIKHSSFSEAALGSEEMSKMIKRFKTHVRKASVEPSHTATIRPSSSNDSVDISFVTTNLAGGSLARGGAVTVTTPKSKASEVEVLKARKSQRRCC